MVEIGLSAMGTSNEKFLTKTGQLGLPQKGQKEASNLQSKALTSLVHFVV